MSTQMIEIPEAQTDKEHGIKGLIQIVTQSRDKNTKEQSMEIAGRYFAKFARRMEKVGTPITYDEEY